MNRFEKKSKKHLTKHGVLKFFEENRPGSGNWTTKISEENYEIRMKRHSPLDKQDPVFWTKSVYELGKVSDEHADECRIMQIDAWHKAEERK